MNAYAYDVHDLNLPQCISFRQHYIGSSLHVYMTVQIGSVLERNFTWSFEKFSELAENGNPIGQQVCTSPNAQ